METTHTSGPWYESSTGNHQGLVISRATSANVAVTYEKNDARLIAAAPDLLEALRLMLEAQSKRRHPLGAPDEGIATLCAEASNAARAAIAKATEQA